MFGRGGLNRGQTDDLYLSALHFTGQYLLSCGRAPVVTFLSVYNLSRILINLQKRLALLTLLPNPPP